MDSSEMQKTRERFDISWPHYLADKVPAVEMLKLTTQTHRCQEADVEKLQQRDYSNLKVGYI